jgi:Spy/CpxP family protein refolding chaperone
MTSHVCRQLMTALFLLSLTAGSALASNQQGPPPRWWKTDAIVKELGLSADQSARIDQIFESTLPELRQERDELERFEAKLSRMIQDDRNDEATLARQIDRVETARASANKTRSLMLMRMYKILTTDQRQRFEQITKRWNDRGQSPGRGSRPGSGDGKPPNTSSNPPGPRGF